MIKQPLPINPSPQTRNFFAHTLHSQHSLLNFIWQFTGFHAKLTNNRLFISFKMNHSIHLASKTLSARLEDNT
jgi:hypothetical protein